VSHLEGHLKEKHNQVRSVSSHVPSEQEEENFHRMLHGGDTHKPAGKPQHHHSPADGSNTHPGFERVQERIARRTNPRTGQPYGKERAGAILAASARHASARAKARNPRLKKV